MSTNNGNEKETKKEEQPNGLKNPPEVTTFAGEGDDTGPNPPTPPPPPPNPIKP